jgi:pleckstrin family protein A (phosphoinositide binding specific) protein 8
MEGILYKWTNYITGWQSRWFKLEMPLGVLSYYRSEDEVGQASRGSLKMACCDIGVHQTDPLRLDLHIPGQQRMYLRAPTTQDRQKWLVALGSAKACLLDSNTTGDGGIPFSVVGLKEKMAELHMVCQLVVNQVSDVKTYAMKQPECVQALNESVTLLSATCDTFLSVLADCMDMADHSLSVGESPTSAHPDMTFHQFNTALHSKSKATGSALTLHMPKDKSRPKQDSGSSTPSLTSTPHQSPPLQKGPPFMNPKSNPIHRQYNKSPQTQRHEMSNQPADQSAQRQSQSQSGNSNMDFQPSSQYGSHVTMTDQVASQNESQNDAFQSVGSSPVISPTTSQTCLDQANSRECTDGGEQNGRHAGLVQSQSSELKVSVAVHVRRYETFFSKTPVKFEEIQVDDVGAIPTKPFLDACSSILPLLDALGGTAFAPVKMDINGNIAKLMKRFDSNPNQFSTLQMMINNEILSNTCTVKNSATDALLWLKRLAQSKCNSFCYSRGNLNLIVTSLAKRQPVFVSKTLYRIT